MYPKEVLKVVGYLETGAGLGLTIGPIIGSSLFAIAGFNTPYYTFCGIFLILGLLSLIFVKESDN